MLKNQHTLDKVLAEIDDVVGSRDCSQQPISHTESNQMPYFQAVIKEALRMHPAVGLTLERVVPIGGVEIAGQWLPEGTAVGICPWVLHRDKRVFGDDADQFRPERWLEADEETLKVMNRSSLAVSVLFKLPQLGQFTNSSKFGSGSRTCLGKHISLLEMGKVVPQLLWMFEVSQGSNNHGILSPLRFFSLSL